MVIGQKHCVFDFHLEFSPQNCYFFPTKLLLFDHIFFKLLFAAGNALAARFFFGPEAHIFLTPVAQISWVFPRSRAPNFLIMRNYFADQKADTGNAHALEWRAPEH